MSKQPITYVIKKKKKHRLRKAFVILLKLILILIILLLIGVLVAETLAFLYLKDIYSTMGEDIEKLMLGVDIDYANSVILDIDGNYLATLNGDEKREIITLSEMPDYLPKAYIAIEDERFKEHYGIDIRRTARAIITYIKNDGYSSFGGSTITQQLVKNVTNDREDTVDRKVREWILAYELEQRYSKDEILEKYLNIIFVGSDVYGVELGSQYYFNKSASELTLSECAYLAGITHSPNLYNPFDGTDNGETIKNRTIIVLKKMLETGAISQMEYNKAFAETNRGLKFEKGNEVNTVYSYHTDAALNQIIEEVAEQNNLSIPMAKSYLYSGGFTIYTTQNSNIQSILEQDFNNPQFMQPSLSREGETTQAAMVVIDHTNGFVVGCVGGLGEKTVSRGLNRATQSPRQTGSSMKPIAVVGPAMQERIITAASIYSDVRTTFTLKTGESYTPKNYNYYRGKITVRQALETSQNIPFVKIMQELTTDKSKEYLKKMGITTLTEKDNDLALAIGGLDLGISPLEMAGAYATIANGGTYIEPTFYTKVVDSKGNVVLQANQEKRRVFTEPNAYVLQNLLMQPVVGSRGTAKNCAISGIDVAAKTGTTDKDYDRWLCGFTPYYTAATWFGYDYNETVRYGATNPAGLLWAGAMSRIHEGLPEATFKMPDGVETYKVCKSTGMIATPRCWSTYEEIFWVDNLPKSCTTHSYRGY